MRHSPRLYRGVLLSLVALAGERGHGERADEPQTGKASLRRPNDRLRRHIDTDDRAGRHVMAGRARGRDAVRAALPRRRSDVFCPRTKIDTQGATLDSGPDARPKLVVEANGTAVLAYATFRDDAFNGEVFTTRSTDAGSTFAQPKPITDVQESQRFQDLALDADGSIFAVWLDKRDRVPFKARGAPYPGARARLQLVARRRRDVRPGEDRPRQHLRMLPARSRLQGGRANPSSSSATFSPAASRDHAVLTFDAPDRPGAPRRVSTDDWAIDVCPHHGPSLAVAADGSYHAVWFTRGRVRKGLFYAHSEDAGGTFSDPLPLGEPGHALSRPFVLAVNGTVYARLEGL